jgi:hypothetical protein
VEDQNWAKDESEQKQHLEEEILDINELSLG